MWRSHQDGSGGGGGHAALGATASFSRSGGAGGSGTLTSLVTPGQEDIHAALDELERGDSFSGRPGAEQGSGSEARPTGLVRVVHQLRALWRHRGRCAGACV